MSYTAGVPPRHHHAIGIRFDPPIFNVQLLTNAVYPAADLAIYTPVCVFERIIVRKLFATNGSAVSGNINVALYDAGGARIVDGGQTTQSGTSTEQVFDVTDTTIGPGLYYVGVTLDNTTGRLGCSNAAVPLSAASGVLSEQLGTGAALPATATFAVPQTLAYIPNVGLLVEATVA